MSRYFQRPENALKKANEFIEVGKPTRALDTLYDVIKGKKHRTFTEKIIEPIMLKYLELCVELKKPHIAKEGLYQYRLMCQAVNIGLLEKVIRTYIKMAEERTEAAREALKTKSTTEENAPQDIVEVDDLDNLPMTEVTLLNIITEEQAQERSDRAALIPWVKFLWESYTQCLDLLRNNARLENLYHDIAQMAFKFCLSYNRKTEFRKLCERLRKHFDDIINRPSSQINSIDFSSPETQQLNMETRLVQLDSAISMELWQEAYKAIEDIHLLMNQSRKSQTRMMAYYYQKLSLVFWKSGNYLFHAATLLKYYLLCKDMKKTLSHEELQKNASQVALATLAIPFPVHHPEFERFVETEKGMMEKAQKLATLLFLSQPPTRKSLIRDLRRYGVLANSVPALQELYHVLEVEFNPLELCTDVNRITQALVQNKEQEYLKQYVEPLQDVALVRLIKQVSQLYKTIDYEHFLSLGVFGDKSLLEQLLVDAVRFNDMQIMIDHRSNCVRFGVSLAEASREDVPEGPHLQEMPSETVRLQLVNVFNCLEETVDMIAPLHLQAVEDKLRSQIHNHYLTYEKQNHHKLIQRQKIIAERREELERTAVNRENEEKWRNEQLVKQQMLLEHKRLVTEREEREKKRLENERQEIQARIFKEQMDKLAKTPFGKNVFKKLEEDDLGKLDVETVMQRQQEEMIKEAREHQQRLKFQAKRFDHLERAKRLEEIPITEKTFTEKKEQEQKDWEIHEQERITNLIEERKIAVGNRDRMKRMMEDKDAFLKNLLDSRRDVYLAKLANYEKKFAEEKAKRLAERKQQRRDDRRRKYLEEQEEVERRRQEEIRQREEEKMRQERERIEKEKEEANKLTLEKQLARNRELEERESREKPQQQQPTTGVWQPRWKSSGGASAGNTDVRKDREREQDGRQERTPHREDPEMRLGRNLNRELEAEDRRDRSNNRDLQAEPRRDRNANRELDDLRRDRYGTRDQEMEPPGRARQPNSRDFDMEPPRTRQSNSREFDMEPIRARQSNSREVDVEPTRARQLNTREFDMEPTRGRQSNSREFEVGGRRERPAIREDFDLRRDRDRHIRDEEKEGGGDKQSPAWQPNWRRGGSSAGGGRDSEPRKDKDIEPRRPRESNWREEKRDRDAGENDGSWRSGPAKKDTTA